MIRLISWMGWTVEDWVEFAAWVMVGVSIGLAITSASLIGLLML
mgnify:CR=1 FL=1